MTDFATWLARRTMREELGGVRFGFGDEDRAGDYERDEKDLIRLLSTRYQSELQEFITRLARDRADDELASLGRRISSDRRPSHDLRVTHSTDRDEVVPPEADRGAEMSGAQ